MSNSRVIRNAFLPGLPVDLIRACYDAAPGNEFASRKFLSPESSAALAANAFGYFMDSAGALPPLPGTKHIDWPANSIVLEGCLRFPWAGGRHPYLDVVVKTEKFLIGIESKRFEPFRDEPSVSLSSAYWRPVWGKAMSGFEKMRDDLKARKVVYQHLDACQLVKHAFGLRTQACRARPTKKPILIYLYAEPSRWPNGKLLPDDTVRRHRKEIRDFASRVKDDEVAFLSCDYKRYSPHGSRVTLNSRVMPEQLRPLSHPQRLTADPRKLTYRDN